MHDTALELGKLFFRLYVPRTKRRVHILEIGSQNVNGGVRSFAPANATYMGVDLAAGEGVDIVLDDPNALPFTDNKFDFAISTSCLEHDQFFWLTICEMFRVLKAGGYLYINAPSNGDYHQYPCDNWRFYPDASVALRAWLRKNGYSCTLIESGVCDRAADNWNDFYMVLRKSKKPPKNQQLIAEVSTLKIRNHRSFRAEEIASRTAKTQDRELLEDARRALLAANPSGALNALTERLLGDWSNSPYRNDPEIPPDFDYRFYLARNKDVLLANADPFRHYVKFGKKEGRKWTLA